MNPRLMNNRSFTPCWLVLLVAASSPLAVNSQLGNEGFQRCPRNSLYHCDNPAFVIQDSSVDCDWFTCAWDLSLLSPDRRPELCDDVDLVVNENHDYAEDELVQGRPPTPVHDFLEPCLWWEMLYGDRRPTPAPSASPKPSSLPTPSPTLLPTALPTLSGAPSGVPTIAPSGLPTGMPSGQTAVPTTSAPTSAPVEEETEIVPEEEPKDDTPAPPTFEETTVTVEFTTLLLTFLLTPPERRRLRVEPSLLVGRKLQQSGVKGYLDEDTRHQKLRELTEAHLVATVPDAQQAIVALSTLREVPVPDGGAAVTQVLRGALTVTAGPADVLTPSQAEASEVRDKLTAMVNQQVRRAFQGQAMDDYVASLQNESTDDLLRTTSQVFVGLPPASIENDPFADGIFPSDDLFMGDKGANTEGEEDKTFSWSPLWIAILAGGGAGVIGLCAVAFYVCHSRRRLERLRRQDAIKATLTGSFTHGSPRSIEAVEPHDPSHCVMRVMAQADDNSDYIISDNVLPDLTGDESVIENDLASQATSMYSYIEKSTMAGNESLNTTAVMLEDYRAGSVVGDDMTAEGTPDRRKKQPRMWSVMKGLEGLSEQSSKSLMSPASRRRISAVAVQQTNDVAESSLEETFEDELLPPLPTKYSPTGKVRVIGLSSQKIMTQSQENDGIYIFDDNASLISDSGSNIVASYSAEAALKIGETGGRPASPIEKVAELTAIVAKVNAQNEAESETDDESAKPIGNGLGGELSQVMEGSENSSRISSSSSDPSPSHNKSSLTTSRLDNKENALLRQSERLMAALDNSLTSDDDSLFISPEETLPVTKKRQQGTLAEQEKRRLGERNPPLSSGGIQMPANYSLPDTSDKEDTSFLTSGSSHVATYPSDYMSSF